MAAELQAMQDLPEAELAEIASELAKETGQPVDVAQLQALLKSGNLVETAEEEIMDDQPDMPPLPMEKNVEEVPWDEKSIDRKAKKANRDMEELMKHLPASEKRFVLESMKAERERLEAGASALREEQEEMEETEEREGSDGEEEEEEEMAGLWREDEDEEGSTSSRVTVARKKQPSRWDRASYGEEEDESELGSEEESDDEREDGLAGSDAEEKMAQRAAARERRRWLQRHRITPYSPAAKGSVVLPQSLRDKIHHVSKSLRRLPPGATAGAAMTSDEVTTERKSESDGSATGGAPLPNRSMQRQLLRQALHERMRSEVDEAAAIVQGTKQTERPQLVYSLAEAGAYLTDHMPGSYASLVRIFAEVEELLPEFTPQSVLDFGAGPCTSLFAADHLWGDNVVKEVLAVEPSSSMTEVAQAMTKWDARVSYRRYLSRGREAAAYDLVVAAGSLNCVEDVRERRSVIRSLWKNVADRGVLVVAETGSPLGFELVREARSVVLVDDLVPGRMVAPCPHAEACPMAGTGRWCHFKQRVQLLREQSKAGVVQNFQDVPFSYVVLQKQATVGGGGGQPTPAGVEAEAWGRVVRKPRKRGGHVMLDLCAPDGTLEEEVVSKARGKDWYSSARKVRWGDGFEVLPERGPRVLKPRKFDKEYREATAGRALDKRTPEEAFAKLFVEKEKALGKGKAKRARRPHWSKDN